MKWNENEKEVNKKRLVKHTQHTVVQLFKKIYMHFLRTRKSQRINAAAALFIMTVEQDLFMRCANAWKFLCVVLLNYKNTVKCANNAITFRINASMWCDTDYHRQSFFTFIFNYYFRRYCCCSFILLILGFFLDSFWHTKDEWKYKFKICLLQITYPNRWHHFVQLYWQSIYQLSSIERRFVLTIWMSGAGVFQQNSLSSALCLTVVCCCCCWSMIQYLLFVSVCVSMTRCEWWKKNNNNRNECN